MSFLTAAYLIPCDKLANVVPDRAQGCVYRQLFSCGDRGYLRWSIVQASLSGKLLLQVLPRQRSPGTGELTSLQPQVISRALIMRAPHQEGKWKCEWHLGVAVPEIQATHTSPAAPGSAGGRGRARRRSEQRPVRY
jgi:hypothetical protein